MRRLRFVSAVGVIALAAFTSAATGQSGAGFQTSQAAMVTCPNCDEVTPIITVGETMPGGYLFEAIPDGVALRARGNGRLDLFVNHETSTVPFPYNPTVADPGESQNDFVNSEVSHLVLNQRSKGVLSAKKVIPSAANYQRFCTNYMATKAEGFDRPVLFANEEAQDWVFRTGTAWPGPGFIAPGTAEAEQAGVTAAYDVQRNKYETIYGMGRLNHENTVAISVEEGIALLTTDDTFFTTPLAAPYKPAWSQLYLYLADDVDDLMNDGGDLYAFVSETAGYDDYFDFDPSTAPASQPIIDGHFIKVPKHIARGKHPTTGAELLSTSTGAGYTGMQPPPAVSGAPPDGPQWVLDQWGNANINAQDAEAPAAGEDVFRFVRLEDIAYDKRPEMSNHVYISDTGRATAGTAPNPNPAVDDLSTNGRIWKFVLDPSNPTDNVKLSLLIEGDNNPVSTTNSTLAAGEIHQPDNMETTANGSLFIQEDPSTNNQFGHYAGVGAPITDTNRTTARIWRYDLDTGTLDVVARVASNAENTTNLGDEVNDDDPADNPPFAGGSFPLSPGNLGAWETSGIVDASSVFGDGALFLTVQAHTFWVDAAPGFDRVPTTGQQDFMLKREGGQLLLIRNEGW